MLHDPPQFTLVRHSAYTQAANPAYEEALEAWPVDRAQAVRVRAAGGRLWPTREAAEADIPNVRGHFSSLRIGGGELFVPG